MYIPQAFAEADQGKLHGFIEAHSFGLLVSAHEGGPFASHLPFLLERDAGPHGTLVGHMARANPQWRHTDGRPVLAVFSGPHAYVSPSWYEAENVVPTWNYAAVHVYGTFESVEDPAELLGIVRDTVRVYEAAMPRPWQLDEASAYSRGMLRQIVGFRVRVGRIEGKWKLNQNHPEERRRKVVRALEQIAGDDAREVAALMREQLDGRPGERP